MMIKEILTRAIFYGALIAVSVLCVRLINRPIPSHTAADIILGFSFFFSITQAFNLLIIRNTSDIRKADSLGFWAKWRLDPRLEGQQKIAKNRIITGLIIALSLAAIGIYVKFLNGSALPEYLAGISLGLIIVSIYIAFIAILDFFHLNKFDIEFTAAAKQAEKIKKALEEINKKN